MRSARSAGSLCEAKRRAPRASAATSPMVRTADRRHACLASAIHDSGVVVARRDRAAEQLLDAIDRDAPARHRTREHADVVRRRRVRDERCIQPRRRVELQRSIVGVVLRDREVIEGRELDDGVRDGIEPETSSRSRACPRSSADGDRRARRAPRDAAPPTVAARRACRTPSPGCRRDASRARRASRARHRAVRRPRSAARRGSSSRAGIADSSRSRGPSRAVADR
jgi:hypothetical protein